MDKLPICRLPSPPRQVPVKMEKLIKSFKTLLRRGLLGVVLSLALSASSLTFGFLPSALGLVTTYCAAGLGASFSAPTYTTSNTINISYSSLHCTPGSGTYNFKYIYLLMSNVGNNLNGAPLATNVYLGVLNSAGNLGNNSVPDTMSLGGGSGSDGSHTVWLGIYACSAQTGSYYPNFASSEYTSHLPAGYCIGSGATALWSVSTTQDSQAPTAAGHLNSTCFSPGGTVQLIDGGSGDPSPSSGWNTNSGMWYYSTNWGGGDSGWTNSNYGSWVVPTPAGGTQGNYTAYEYIRDNAFNQSAPAGYGFNVDNGTPSGGWISPSAATTNSTTVNLSFAANAGGCKGIGNVAISNNQGNWWYSGYNLTYFGGWDFTNPTYGGNANQGTHTVYIAFNEAGTSNWSYYQTTVTYDTGSPTVAASLSVGASTFTNSTSINTSYSTSDGTSGVQNWALYDQSAPVSGNACQTGSASGWNALASGNGPTSNTYTNSGLANNTCYQWAMNANDNAGNHGYQSDGEGGNSPTQWVMIDTSAPSSGVPAPSMSYANASTNVSGWSANWSAATDNASGVASVTLTELSATASGGGCPAAGGSWGVAWTTANLGAGATTYNGISGGGNNTCYAYKVNVTDRAGNSFTSGQGAAILVDTTPPAAPAAPLLTVASDTGTSHTDGLTSIANGLVLTGSAEAGSTINIYVDGGATAIASPVTATGGIYSITTSTTLSAGIHTLTIKATDPAGNVSSVSSSYTVVVHTTCPF
jgi:hypothetical protein